MAKQVQYLGTGRRKASVARVILTSGEGKFTVNGRDFSHFFASDATRLDITQPLDMTETRAKFDVRVNVFGGGTTGQAGAVRLGIARALLEINADYRETLKPAGMLTRDSRRVERKKYGFRKARKSAQFSKR